MCPKRQAAFIIYKAVVQRALYVLCDMFERATVSCGWIFVWRASSQAIYAIYFLVESTRYWNMPIALTCGYVWLLSFVSVGSIACIWTPEIMVCLMHVHDACAVSWWMFAWAAIVRCATSSLWNPYWSTIRLVGLPLLDFYDIFGFEVSSSFRYSALEFVATVKSSMVTARIVMEYFVLCMCIFWSASSLVYKCSKGISEFIC